MSKLIIQTEYDTALFDTIQKEGAKQPDIDSNSSVVFLDADGVLNSGQWLEANPSISFEEDLNPKAIERLNAITDKNGAKVIISSNKRLRFLNQPDGFNKLVEF